MNQAATRYAIQAGLRNTMNPTLGAVDPYALIGGNTLPILAAVAGGAFLIWQISKGGRRSRSRDVAVAKADYIGRIARAQGRIPKV